MQFNPSDLERKRAKAAHELFVANLFGFHLLLAPAAIALKIGLWALLLPVVLSGMVIAFIAWRGRQGGGEWFVTAHWRLAFRRSLLLVGGYLGSALVLGIAFALSLQSADARMAHIMVEALTRIAIMPTFLMVLVTFFLESGAINLAVRGELPDGFVQRNPPPGGVETTPAVADG